MAKIELTQEQKDFRIDEHTLNRQLMFFLEKSKCVVWNLRKAKDFYNNLRKTNDHVGALDITKKEMFKLGLK